MKKAIALGFIASFAVLAAAPRAHADSISDYIQFEAGIGGAIYGDRGDGTWTQKGAPLNKESLTTITATAGLTGPIIEREHWGVNWHADYQYLGTASAQCMCTIDDRNYDIHSHRIVDTIPDVPLEWFNGYGHTQGVAFMLEPYYATHGWRFGVLGGAYVNVPVWYESVTQQPGTVFTDVHVRAVHTVNVGMVVGATISRGNWSLRYQYFKLPYHGNEFPPIFSRAQTLSVIYKF